MTRVRIGDVVAIALDDDNVAYAHVLARHSLLGFYFGVCNGAHARSEELPVERIVEAGYALLGHADGDLIKRGDWPVVGRVKPDPSRFPFPRFKIWHGGPDSPTLAAEWDRQERRVARPDELPVLLGMTTWSASLIAEAARALHDLAPWRPEFDDLRIERVARSHGRAEPDGKDRRPITPREVDPESPTEVVALLLFHGPVERARAAQAQLQAGGWNVSLSPEDESGEGHFLEATRSVAWRDVFAVRDDTEALATRLGADDFGWEVALPPR